KKLDGGPEPTGPAFSPVNDSIRIFAWEKDLIPPIGKQTLPDNVDLIGHIPVDKLVSRNKKINDPLLGIIRGWEQSEYDSTTWTAEAYTKMFEKFHYKDPIDFVEEEPELTILCDRAVLEEHDYMANSVITPIMSTVKNMDSTPAYPKFQLYATEEEYLMDCGWSEYLEVVTSLDTLNHRPLWWCFLKNEVLKKSKIENNDIRMILCTDPVFTRIGAMFDQDQNTKMKKMTEEKSAQVGWTPFFGGLDQRVRRLMKIPNPQFIEMDWTRFDGTIPKALFWRIRQIRFFLLADEFKTKHNKKFFDWYTKNLLEKIILLPTGEVCQVKKGNPSGQFSTTVDNNMCNVWLTNFEIAWLHRKQKGRLPTVKELRENICFICYGDDRLLSVNRDFVKYDPAEVIHMYENIFGMWVKPENVKVSNVPEGLSFCGMTLVKNDTGKFVGIPNVNKILSTLRTPTRKLPNLEALWGKLVSLRILCQNTDPSVREYLERQILAVEEYAAKEDIKLPEVGPDFYSKIW
ncbi:RdRp, partial [Duck astrovirus CPH]